MTVTEEEFLALSAELTGFAAAQLRRTGLADGYLELTVKRLGEPALRALLTDRSGAAAADLAHLWYVGGWPDEPELVSGEAYRQALVWRTIGVRAPATDPAGYGSWSAPPSLGPGAAR
ncbi:hypothetical protein [Kitasatospora viridis]|uniref:Uncharacterized protein n=1 Tax=Kitasatospora viridis TaxID=281105 RepID=A0A561UQ69_9ACTN|nr:hypothetical protein [Kitasatospora viridis]TWG01527.1 hypothetical protein FHX73_115428 [Kitasatospora viridis]